jgi:hypothetical protein
MDPLTIALAIYGGYQGYTSAKRAHANTLGQIFGTALGTYGGYSLGSGITGSELGQQYLPSILTEKVTPSVSQLFSTGANPAINGLISEGGIGAFSDQAAQNIGSSITSPATASLMNEEAARQTAMLNNLGTQATGIGTFQQLPIVDKFAGDTSGIASNSLIKEDSLIDKNKEKSFLNQVGTSVKNTFVDPNTGEIKLGNAALVGVPAALYASGAFERKPYERSLFTYDVNYPDLYRNRSFQVQDPKTGKVYDMPQQGYIPEEKAKASITNPNQQFGPYKRETITLREGGLATLSHFKDGGVSYLPTKSYNDETDEKNYLRVNGYIEDASGTADKNEDTMLAQLADGEFVTRTDGILGAGILAGADPSDEKQMRKMGADFFYEQQKRFKRIFDLLDASRKATQH